MKRVNLIKQASEIAGGTSALARILGRSPSEVSQWVSGNRPIPLAYCAAIERATNGQVTRKDLRPQDWMAIWPELAESQASAGAISRHALRPDSFGAQSETKEAVNG